jgi:hypothetical protein
VVSPALARCINAGTCEIGEVSSFVIVESQGLGHRAKDVCGHTNDVAAFDLGVVLGADAGELGDLLATKTGNASAPTARDTYLFRGNPGAAGHQEFSDVLGDVHPTTVRTPWARWGVLVIPWINGVSPGAADRSYRRSVDTFYRIESEVTVMPNDDDEAQQAFDNFVQLWTTGTTAGRRAPVYRRPDEVGLGYGT